MKNKINIIDLFVGCGGLSDGFEQTGKYNTIACVEWEKAPCLTLANRLRSKWNYKNADQIVLQFDIQKTDELIKGWSNDPLYGSNLGLEEIVRDSNKKIDVIIGGPPCQAYSIAGRIRDEKGMNDDYRNFLFESYLKVVDHFQPKLFIFENVPGILSAKPGGIPITERISGSLEKIGYEIISDLREALIDSSLYGVPQARNRMVIIGVNRSLIKENEQIALKDFYHEIITQYYSDKKYTVKDAIEDLPSLFPLPKVEKHEGRNYSHEYKKIKILNHIPRMHNKRDMEIFKLLAEDIQKGINKYTTSDALINLYYEVTGRETNVHKYHVLRWDKPSNTIPAHLYKDGLRHIHPDPKQARSITVREAARLQSFDDDFEFLGSMTDQYKMIGNAVPPKFAKAIALAIEEFINKYF